MKLHIRHLQIQITNMTIAGVLDSPVLVLFSSVTSGSGNPEYSLSWPFNVIICFIHLGFFV
jgi:hypothetical protein